MRIIPSELRRSCWVPTGDSKSRVKNELDKFFVCATWAPHSSLDFNRYPAREFGQFVDNCGRSLDFARCLYRL